MYCGHMLGIGKNSTETHIAPFLVRFPPVLSFSLALKIELLLWPLEKRDKEMATHSSTHAWKIPWMEKPGGLQSMGSQRVGSTERLHFHLLSLLFSALRVEFTSEF